MARPPRYRSMVLKYLRLIAFKRRTLGKVMEQQTARQPDAVCCRFEEDSATYREINEQANRRANLLGAMGIGLGDVVAVLMENRPEFIATVVGLAKLGAVGALINTNLRGPSLAHCLDISSARRVIVGRECLEVLNEVLPDLKQLGADRVLVDTRWEGGAKSLPGEQDLNALLPGADATNPPRPRINSQDALCYIYTSGTTGLPKAAKITHYRWYGAGLVMGYYGLHLTADDTVYCPLPMYHSNGIMIAFGSALVSGSALALSRHFSASSFWSEATRMGATTFIYIGEVLRYLLQQPPAPEDRAHSITRILGNGLRPDVWPGFVERFGISTIREFYASTEGNVVTINMNETPTAVGTPVLAFSDNTVLLRYDVEADNYLRDAEGKLQACAPGEVGEMVGQIKSTTPFHGYTSQQDTEKKILRNVFKQGDAYFRTGDLMRKDEAGNYYFTDRIGDTFRWKGENVATQEVQELLSGFDGVALCNVYGVPVPGADGRAGMAALQLNEGSAFDAAAFLRLADERLPPYAVPLFVRLVSAMNITGTFKVRKTEFKAQGFDPTKIGGAMYYLDRAQGAYLPLDAAAYQRIQGGDVRF